MTPYESSKPAVVMLLFASLSWGVSAALSKVALEQLSPVDLFGIEVGTGALALSAIALARGARPARPSAAVLLLGLLEPGLAYLLFDVGLAHPDATHGALLLSTESLFTVGLAAVLLRERLDARLSLALAAGFAGSVLVSLHGSGTVSSFVGDLLVVAASLAAAGYAVLARRIAPGRNVLSLTAVQMLSAAAVSLPLAAAAVAHRDSRIGHADATHVLVAVSVGVLASVVPFLLYNAAIDRVTATAAGLVLTLIPLFGTLASIILLSESLGFGQLVGGGFVVSAAMLAATRNGHAPPTAARAA